MLSVGGPVSREIVYNPGSPIKVLKAYQLPKLISDQQTRLYNFRTFLRRQLQVNIVSFNTNSGGRSTYLNGQCSDLPDYATLHCSGDIGTKSDWLNETE